MLISSYFETHFVDIDLLTNYYYYYYYYYWYPLASSIRGTSILLN